jgi:bifunctional non-homologous end joining protein LigD
LSESEHSVRVDGRELKLTNLDKVLWPEEKITKAEVIKYYAELGPFMISFIKDRPIMAQRYPHGIGSQFFVQKHFTAVPGWVQQFSLRASSSIHKGRYVLCNDLPTLIWLGNLAALEINHMLARTPRVTRHDIVLIDLDPHPPARFDDSVIVARGVATLLERLQLQFLLKTSGADGTHFLIPIQPRFSVAQIRRFVYALGRLVEKANPKLATVSTRRDRKKGRVYIDFLQNATEKTITAPLSVRALPRAPVSFPLTVRQLYDSKLAPERYTVRAAPRDAVALRRMRALSAMAQDLAPAFGKLGISP